MRRLLIVVLVAAALVESAILWRRTHEDGESPGGREDRKAAADRTESSPGSGTGARSPIPAGGSKKPGLEGDLGGGTNDGEVSSGAERAPTDPREFFREVERLRTVASQKERAHLARVLAYRINSARAFNFQSALPAKTVALERLQDPIPEVRLIWSAIAVLYEAPEIDDAVAGIAAGDSDPYARAMALDILGQRPLSQARADTLIGAASDQNIECRIAAVRSLRVVDDLRSLAPVAQASRAKDLRLRRVAWETLGVRAAREPQSLDELRRLIREEREPYEWRIFWRSITAVGAEKLLSREDLATIEAELHH